MGDVKQSCILRGEEAQFCCKFPRIRPLAHLMRASVKVKGLRWLEAVASERGRGILVFSMNVELHNLRKIIWWDLH
jgi:hypothetical protein